MAARLPVRGDFRCATPVFSVPVNGLNNPNMVQELRRKRIPRAIGGAVDGSNGAVLAGRWT
jgi:hypothetical protein